MSRVQENGVATRENSAKVSFASNEKSLKLNKEDDHLQEKKLEANQSILKTKKISQIDNSMVHLSIGTSNKPSSNGLNSKASPSPSKNKRVTFSSSLVTIHEVESYKRYNAMTDGSGQWCTGCSLV